MCQERLTVFRHFDPARITTLLCDADGNLFPSEEPAYEASVEVTNPVKCWASPPPVGWPSRTRCPGSCRQSRRAS